MSPLNSFPRQVNHEHASVVLFRRAFDFGCFRLDDRVYCRFALGSRASGEFPGTAKVCFFFADGAGITHMEITRLYNRFVHNEGLVIADRIMKQGTLASSRPMRPILLRRTRLLLHEGNSKGFFVSIENENVDTASHLSDIASVIRDYREFDRGVGLAYEFYKKYPRDTLILVTSDHETGGLGFTLALKDLSSRGTSNQVGATIDNLKKIDAISVSLKKASEMLGPNPAGEPVDDLMREYFKGFALAPDYKEAIIKRQSISRSIFIDPTTNALGMMVAKPIFSTGIDIGIF